MDYQEFIRTIRSRGGFVSDERAERLAATTLETLGEMLASADKREVGKQIPSELHGAFEQSTQIQTYSLDEFFSRIAAREGTTFEDARRDVLIVVSVLRDALTTEGADKLWERLPGEYRRLLNPGAPPAPTV